MQPESDNFIRNGSGIIKPIDSSELLKVYDAMQSVFNVGLAVEQKLTDKITGYAAFRTDFSNADFEDINGLVVGFTDWNNYHFTAGASTIYNDTFIGVGFEYTHGQRSDFTSVI